MIIASARMRVSAALVAACCVAVLSGCAQGADSHVGELPSSASASGVASASASADGSASAAGDASASAAEGAAASTASDDAATAGSSLDSAGIDTRGAAKEYAATVEHIYPTEVDPEAGYRHATPEEAAELMKQEGSILVDVRGEVDWDYMHIPGSVPIAFNVITGDEGREKLPDKDQLIILYCDYGGMSKIAAEDLVYSGYTNVVEFNGLEVWDGPVEGEFLKEGKYAEAQASAAAADASSAPASASAGSSSQAGGKEVQ